MTVKETPAEKAVRLQRDHAHAERDRVRRDAVAHGNTQDAEAGQALAWVVGRLERLHGVPFANEPARAHYTNAKDVLEGTSDRVRDTLPFAVARLEFVKGVPAQNDPEYGQWLNALRVAVEIPHPYRERLADLVPVNSSVVEVPVEPEPEPEPELEPEPPKKRGLFGGRADG